jgi:hypothetical protein
MQAVLTGAKLWSNIRSKARKAKRRRLAIAYVTKDLIGLKKGDLLVVDASIHAIRFGETSAKLLHTLCKRGVDIYSCPDLHAMSCTRFG